LGCLGLGLGDCPKHPSLQKTSAVEGPDYDCLFHPELPKCKSDNEKCPDGFFQNEDSNCFPKHDNALRVIIVMKTMKQVDVFQIKHHVNLGIS
jgi:hypothetical protein